MNNDVARAVYGAARHRADALVKVGKLASADRQATFSKFVAEGLAQARLPIPKWAASSVGAEAAALTTVPKAAGQAATSTAAATAATITASQAAKATLRSGAPLALLFFAADVATSAYKCSTGEIDSSEAGKRIAESAASNGGGLGGAVGGAALGTAIFPVVGTAIGAIIGGFGAGIGAKKLMQLLIR